MSNNIETSKTTGNGKPTIKCPKCGADSPAEYNFCELDGTLLRQGSLTPKPIKPISKCECGAIVEDFDEDGFCIDCGTPWQARNRVERQLDKNFAAITDRGLQHHLNEDDVRIASEQFAGTVYKVLVVCDGLSSAQRSREASSQAAQTTLDFLVSNIRRGFSDPRLAMSEAIMAAHYAVCKIEFEKMDHKDPPGTTIVAAVLGPAQATIGWVGDSRAYIVSKTGAKLLTHDHSWINKVVDAGILTEAEAQVSMNAHVITHCLGPIETATAGTLPIPAVVSADVADAEMIVLCSDGLWNYAERIEEFDTALGATMKDGDALALAKQLVAFALGKGGRDNITVAIAANNSW